MGFLDDYDVDLNEFNESGFDVPNGTYEFEVVGCELRIGTAADDEARNIVVAFSLENEDGETYSWNWWLKVPDDPARPTRRESISMSEWKKWLLAAGFEPSEINGVDGDDVVGYTGTVRIVNTPGKGKNADKSYTNPRDWTFDAEEEEPEPVKPARTAKKAKPAPEPEPDEDDEEEEAAPAKPTRTRAKGNPFEKK